MVIGLVPNDMDCRTAGVTPIVVLPAIGGGGDGDVDVQGTVAVIVTAGSTLLPVTSPLCGLTVAWLPLLHDTLCVKSTVEPSEKKPVAFI